MMEVASLLERLNLEGEDQSALLSELLKVIGNLSQEQLLALLSQQNSSKFFLLPEIIANSSSKNAKDKYLVEDLGKRIYSLVITNISTRVLTEKYEAELLRILGSQQSEAVETLLNQLIKHLSEDQNWKPSLALMIAVCRVGSQKACRFLEEAIIRVPECLREPRWEPFRAELNLLRRSKNDASRFNFYEVVAEVCKRSPEAMDLCVKADYLEDMLGILRGSDILAKLNVLEILAEMASGAPHVAEFMHGAGVIPQLHDEIAHCQESPDGSFIFPALIRFFGYLARRYPEECNEKYPLFLRSVFQLAQNFHCLEPGQRLLGFDTLALIGSTPAGKRILALHENAMQGCMRSFGIAVKSGPLEIRTRHVEALAQLLRLPVEEQNKELLALTQRWFLAISEKDSFEYLFEMFKQPFVEVHNSVGAVFQSIFTQSWAQKLLAESSGFLEYLLDRNTEFEPSGKHLKYDLVETLLASPSLPDNLDNSSVLRLRQYQREGRFYLRADVEIALDDGAN